ncbi:MAG: hypothetical protein KJI72_03325 [Patescibacteria group bacterium]|nr:hypothetical protein [Patescibacteria group bacterium]
MLKGLFRPGVPFPTNGQEGVAYTEELAGGIKLWTKIDAVVVPLAILLWATGVINTVLLGFAALFAIGCPIIMTLGFSIGCLQYLKLRECYEIVRAKLAASSLWDRVGWR